MDVPDHVEYGLDRYGSTLYGATLFAIDDVIHLPGAIRFRNEALLLKADTAFAVVEKLPSSTEPTLTADDMQPGAPIEPVNPSFPEAITVAMPIDRRLSIAVFTGAFTVSQVDWRKYRPPPRLMFTEAI